MTERWEIERDRFGLMSSRDIAVGECVEVVRAAEFEALVVAAREVVDAAPGYTAEGGSVWKLDHKLDGLRAVLAFVDEPPVVEKPTS